MYRARLFPQHLVTSLQLFGHTKIADSYLIIVANHNIVWFQIAVDYAFGLIVPYGVEHLLHHGVGFFFAVHDGHFVEKRSGAVLHDQIQFVFVLIRAMILHDVFVVEGLQYLQFAH